MTDILARSDLLEGLSEAHRDRLVALALVRELDAGEYLFRLGDVAERAYVVLSGRIEVCFPLSFGGTMQDIAIESMMPGSALGWSAFVSPHHFTLSARAAEPSSAASFSRAELQRLVNEDCAFGQAFITRIAEIVGRRMVKMRALWARELQRSVAGGSLGASGKRGAAPPPLGATS